MAVSHRFGPFELDIAERRLHRDGVAVALQPKAFDLLAYLVEQHGRLLTKDQLLDEVWSGTYVTENSLTRCVRLIRVALSDDPDAPEYLETVPRAGYRFIAEVAVTTTDIDHDDTLLEIDDKGKVTYVHRWRWGVVVAVVLAFFYDQWLPWFVPPEPTVIPENSIAVLPFETCDGDQISPLLAAGITSDVINRLARTREFRVIAPSSSFVYAGFPAPMPEIAASLGVHYLLTGTLCRDGDGLQLSAEVMDKENYLVWSGKANQRPDEYGQLNETLAAQLVRQVTAQLGAVIPATPAIPVDSRAYEDYLIGREYRKAGNKEEAREAFARALEREPEYPEPILALAFMDMGPFLNRRNQREYFDRSEAKLSEAEPLARDIVARRPDMAEAHYTLGRILSLRAWLARAQSFRKPPERNIEEQLEDAEKELRRAIALNPSLIGAYEELSTVISDLERDAEALDILMRGLEIDPLNAGLNVSIAYILQNRGRYRDAINMLERLKTLPESPSKVWFNLLEFHWFNGYYDEYAATLFELLQHEDERLNNSWAARWHPWIFSWILTDLGLDAETDAWLKRLETRRLGDNWRELALTGLMSRRGQTDEVAEKARTWLDAMGDRPITDAAPIVVVNAGIALIKSGDYETGIAVLEKVKTARREYNEQRWAYDDIYLAYAYQRVGRHADAQTLLGSAVAGLESQVESGIRNGDTLALLADTYALQGREQMALKTLRAAIDGHFRTRGPRMGSWWQDLHDHPQYRALVQIMEADLDMQAAIVSRMLAEHDLDALVARLPERSDD